MVGLLLCASLSRPWPDCGPDPELHVRLFPHFPRVLCLRPRCGPATASTPLLNLVPQVGFEPTKVVRPARLQRASFILLDTSAKLLKNWYSRLELNQRPKVYETSAQPLSYTSKLAGREGLAPSRQLLESRPSAWTSTAYWRRQGESNSMPSGEKPSMC